jgi:hypothetical protein
MRRVAIVGRSPLAVDVASGVRQVTQAATIVTFGTDVTAITDGRIEWAYPYRHGLRNGPCRGNRGMNMNDKSRELHDNELDQVSGGANRCCGSISQPKSEPPGSFTPVLLSALGALGGMSGAAGGAHKPA